MKKDICKTCKAISVVGIDILGIHICSDCLNSISDLNMMSSNYDFYKDTIGDAWREYELSKLN